VTNQARRSSKDIDLETRMWHSPLNRVVLGPSEFTRRPWHVICPFRQALTPLLSPSSHGCVTEGYRNVHEHLMPLQVDEGTKEVYTRHGLAAASVIDRVAKKSVSVSFLLLATFVVVVVVVDNGKYQPCVLLPIRIYTSLPPRRTSIIFRNSAVSLPYDSSRSLR
jgi:hypothetical protein